MLEESNSDRFSMEECNEKLVQFVNLDDIPDEEEFIQKII